MKTISIIIPVFNEEKTIYTVITNILQEPFFDEFIKEIIIVNDGSADNSYFIINNLTKKYSEIIMINHKFNQGKGAAIISGLKQASGEIILFQDGDCEYLPINYSEIISPILNNQCDVVFGSRFFNNNNHTLFFQRSVNRLLTGIFNKAYNSKLTDVETGLKAFSSNSINKIDLTQRKFSIEIEIAAKLIKKKFTIFEVDSSFVARTYKAGKKISFLDFFDAIYCIYKYWKQKTFN